MPLPLLSLELLRLHWEELEDLWGRRQTVLRSPVDTPGRLADLDERIEAHVQGLLVGGDAVTPLVESGLSADEPLPAFAAALTLLRSNKEAPVLEVFRQAEAGRLDGIRQALCHAPVATAAPLATSPIARTLLAARSNTRSCACASSLAATKTVSGAGV